MLFLLSTFGLSQPKQADPADVESVDAILTAVYAVISGPAGTVRDWDRFRSLFLPEAKLVPAFKRAGEEKASYRALTPEDYITLSGPTLEKGGFFEQEVHRVVDQFGPAAQVFSTYESRRGIEDKPFARGINSFQLFHDGERWWILSIFWSSERPDLPIPERYLP
jgi:hypothetical protein